jgi:small GTP-binding protein
VQRVLDPALQRQLTNARQLLGEVRDALTRFGATGEDQAALAASIHQLDEFFLLVVVGEFNAGKSAFINALAGQQVLQEGVTPTTAQIHLLRYGDVPGTSIDEQGMRVVSAPAELLREIHIVDTPGTNAIMREHERLTAEFVPRSDLVIFVTSADRPFTETERVFLQSIRDWGKKIIIAVNKVDIFEREADVAEVVAFVRDSARRLLGIVPEVFPVSARNALRAKQGEPSRWAASRFEALERFIRDSLDEGSRFRLKLGNPLGVAQALADRYATIADERLVLLKEDLSLLEEVERQLAIYRGDLARGFELRMTAVEKVLVDMEARGHAYFEDTMRIGRVMDLLNRARIQKEFEDRVGADAPRHIDRRVTELIDWLIDQDFRQWQAVTSRLGERTREHGARVLGAPEVGTFHRDRARLIDSVGREAQRVVDTYDKQREAAAIADQARRP